MQISDGVIHLGRRPRWITPSSICITSPYPTQPHLIKTNYTDTVLNVRLFDSPCRPGIYLPRKMNWKEEPDLSLVRDKFSVRYEC